MDHIFGTSHDIDFGASDKKPLSKIQNNTRNDSVRSRSQDNFLDLESPEKIQRKKTFAEKRRESPISLIPSSQKRDTKTAQVISESQIGDIKSTPPLSRLIDGMKPSFLPKEEDTNIVRLVILSQSGHTDPLMLITRNDTTILLGTGFQNISRAGWDYMTFPDMRLPVSEANHLSAWILLDSWIQPELFQTILPALGFPPLYTTREIIANLRDNIKDADFLSKCRFFELFTPDSPIRRIGDFEFQMNSGFILRAPWTEILFPHLSAYTNPSENTFCLDGGNYSLFNESVEPGEILSIKWKSIVRHSLKFTFDTFYLDKWSVGIVAGYTLTDRVQLAENGVLMFTLEEDTRARTIAGHIFIDSRGFVHAHEMMYVHKEILKWIRTTYEKLLTENPKIDRWSLVQWLRREITKYCYLLTGRTPVVMPIVIER